MTTMDHIVSEVKDGFAADTADVPDPVAAAPTPASAEPAKPAAAAEPAKAADAAKSLLTAAAEAPKYEFKAEGLHADDLKLFADVLGEHKADGKLGQAILDKMLPALNQRREKEAAEHWEKIQKAWTEENAKNPEIDPRKPENAARVKQALAIAGNDVLDGLKERRLLDLPEFNLFAVRVGAFIEKATKQDNAVPGASPAPASRAPDDTSAAAWAESFYSR